MDKWREKVKGKVQGKVQGKVRGLLGRKALGDTAIVPSPNQSAYSVQSNNDAVLQIHTTAVPDHTASNRGEGTGVRKDNTETTNKDTAVTHAVEAHPDASTGSAPASNHEENTGVHQNDGTHAPRKDEAATQETQDHPGASAGASDAPTGHSPDTPDTLPAQAQSLWDRAYEALKKDEPKLVGAYEELLSKEAPAGAAPAAGTNDARQRRAQLDRVIEQGLRRADEKKIKFTIADNEFNLSDQIDGAAKLVLWAKDFVGEAVKVSPQASIAWAGVCLILPLLTNPTTAEEANSSGFRSVTARLRYYVALEPLVERLGNNEGVSKTLLDSVHAQIVELYRSILAFQLRSVLRFYRSRLGTYAKDAVQSDDWKAMFADIQSRERAVNQDLAQINDIAGRQEMELLNRISGSQNLTLQALLNVANQQLKMQQASERQRLEDDQAQCLQLFYRVETVRKVEAAGKATITEKVTYETFKSIVPDRVNGTCQWFLGDGLFQAWLQQASGPLLVSADPGCGKSVLAKSLLDTELAAQEATVCYVFFRDQVYHQVSQALCALLHQLFSQKTGLIEHAMAPFKKKGTALSESTESLWTILGNAVQDPKAGQIIMVLDALDECLRSELRDLVQGLGRLFFGKGGPNLKILMTSRPYDYILDQFRACFDNAERIHIPGEKSSGIISKEIDLVVQHRVQHLTKRLNLSKEITDALKEKLAKVENRTYLWVYLVFDYLENNGWKKTPTAVEKIMQTLPNSVSAVYEKLLGASGDREALRKILSIMLAASRPLTLLEMNVAVAVAETTDGRLEPPSLDDLDLESDADFELRLRNLCGLFVSVYQGSIYFLHQTAREFLVDKDLTGPSPPLWRHSIALSSAEQLLARLCTLYLLAFDTDNKDVLQPSEDERRQGFWTYSTENWPGHIRKANFDQNDAIVPVAAKLHNYPWCSRWQDDIRGADGLLSASFCGHRCFIPQFLRDGDNVDMTDIYGRTPLFWACWWSNTDVVRELLDHGASVGGFPRPPLAVAAERADATTIELLIKHGAVINDTSAGANALFFAARAGNAATVKQLLISKADVNAADVFGRTPLMVAASKERIDVVPLLIKHGARVDTVSLHSIIQSGNEAVVQLLFDHHVRVTQNDLLAALHAEVAIFTQLLKHAVDINMTAFLRSALWELANNGNADLIPVLVSHGADVNARGEFGLTPLAAAAEKGKTEAIRQLISYGANIEARGQWDETPLFRVCDESAAQMMIDHGANVNARSKNGVTPLHKAAYEGSAAIMQALISHDADIEARDRWDETPLFYAAFCGEECAVEMLIEHGANVHARNMWDQTPLHMAAHEGSTSVIQALISHAADIEARSKWDQTPLFEAASQDNESAVQMLIEHGANVNARNKGDRTPLFRAVSIGTTAAAETLLNHDADIHVRDKAGWTPLLRAASAGRAQCVELLINHGADVNARDNRGRTAQMLAADKGHEDVVQLLKSCAK